MERIDAVKSQMEEIATQTRVHQLAISAMTTSVARKSSPLNYKDVEKHIPEEWTGEKGARPFTQYKYDLENWMAALDPSDEGVKIMAWAAGRNVTVDLDMGELECDNTRDFNRALARTLVTSTRGSARTTVQQAGAGNGLDAWRLLVAWNQPRSASDKASSMLALIKPTLCKTLAELRRAIGHLEVQVREHTERFEQIPESLRIAGLLQMIPEVLYEQRFKGKAFDDYMELKSELSNYFLDRRTGNTGPTHMDIGEFEGGDAQSGLEGLKTQINELHAFVKNKKGAGKGSKDNKADTAQWNQTRWSPETQTTNDPKGKGKVKGKGKGKGKDSKKTLVCHNCGGVGHPARMCPSVLEVDAAAETEDPMYDPATEDFEPQEEAQLAPMEYELRLHVWRDQPGG